MADKPNYITLANLRTAISALLNKVDTKPNEEDFSNVAFSGDYSDLTNRPDLSAYVNWTTYSELTDYVSSVASVNGILKCDGDGSITAAIAGTDYQAPLPSTNGNNGKFLSIDNGNLAWSSLGSIFTYKGTKTDIASLPSSGNTIGDVWIVTADNSEHVWNGSAWEELGPTTDLSIYMRKGVDYVTAGRKANTTAGNGTTAEGNNNTVIGPYSHAEGSSNTIQTQGNNAHAEGTGNLVTKASGHAEGENVQVTGVAAHSEGYGTKAIGEEAHAEGAGSYAFGPGSHAEGQSTKAIGDYSHSEGTGFITGNSFAISGSTNGVTYTYPSTYSTLTENDLKNNILVITIGGKEIIRPIYSADTTNFQITLYDPINENTVSTLSSQSCVIIKTNAKGNNSHTEGYATIAESDNSHAEGSETQTKGNGAHAEGGYTKANGNYSHAEGSFTETNKNSSHAEGYYTQANGDYSHAEGYNSSTYGSYSHAEGRGLTFTVKFNSPSGTTYPIYEGQPSDIYQNCPARILGETAEITSFGVSGGKISSITFNQALKNSQGYHSLQFYGTRDAQSHSEGLGTIAYDEAQHAGGKYNIPINGAEVIGGGTASTPANIRTLDWSGNETLAGKLTLGAGPTANMDAATKQYVDTAVGNAASITMVDHSGPTTTQLNSLTINKLTQAQYNAISNPDPNQLYMITDDTIYATKTYVDTAISNIDALPSQSGNSGKFLTTNGSVASWANVESEIFLITATTSNGTITANKTYTEILAAYNAGKICVVNFDNSHICPLMYISTTGASFCKTATTSDGAYQRDVSVTNANVWNTTVVPLQTKTTASGILKGNGSGGVTAAVAGTDYAAASHNHSASNITSGTLGIARGGTGGTTAQDATWNLLHVADPGNLNNAKRMGNFKISNTTTNTPVANMWGATWNIVDDSAAGNNGSSGTTWQLVFQSASTDMWLRTITNAGGWSAYKRVWTEGNAVTGAVWNDYAEYRETDTLEFGRCVSEVGDDTLTLTTKRLQKGCAITSDTWGFAQGKTEKAQTPIAVAGRVLAYPFEDKEEFRKHIGDAVCSGPEGTVSIMTDEEVQKYPLSIIGTISAVPDYEEWGGGSDRDPVKVNGRVWIRIK